MTEKQCIECGVMLIVGENTTQGMIDSRDYRCRECYHELRGEYYRRKECDFICGRAGKIQ